MAVSVNWVTSEITVPKADTTLVGAGPPEIRSFNVQQMRLDVLDLYAAADGAIWPTPFDHGGESLVSGFTYAREIVVKPPYFITFEDGAYVVNLEGGNHNVLDVATANQVSLRAQNSAGLIIGEGGLPPTQEAKLNAILATVNNLPTAVEIKNAVWDAQVVDYLTDGTIGKELADAMAMVTDVWMIEGCDPVNPMNVTPTRRTAGAIDLTITGDGVTTTTVTRQ